MILLTFLVISGLRDAGHVVHNSLFFDTLHVTTACAKAEILSRCNEKQINIRYFPDDSVSCLLYTSRCV